MNAMDDQPQRRKDAPHRMSQPQLQDLLEAGVHFGHQTRRWNPKMRRFIFAERSGIYIIDLQKTLRQIAKAQELLRGVVQKGENVLFADVRYFCYITNDWDTPAEQIVFLANDRCNQENLIEQLKNGVHAMRMPVGDLVSNGAYMVMASLAWTLKAWFALLVRSGEQREELLRMEFRRFLHALVEVPCQIVRTGRRIVYRLLGYTEWTRTFLRTFERICQLAFP
jgi:hypothetical protein